MTAGRFREVDLDLLADYVGGALEGTPAGSAVARLVEEDPAWAQAYDRLAAAVAQVRLDLAAWDDPAPTMPPAVADRLTAALAGAGPAAPALVPTQPSGDPERPRTVLGTTGRPGGSRGRRSWSRRAAPVLVAAAAVAAAGFGVTQFVGAQSAGDDSNAAGREAGDLAAPAAAAPFRLETEPRRTATSYTPQTLAELSAGPGVLSGTTGPTMQAEGGADPRRPAPAADLSRLDTPSALNACLREVSAEHGRGAVRIDLLEYAAFQGEPALVLRLVDPTGERWVWVAGPECGVPGSGADTRYRSRVG